MEIIWNIEKAMNKHTLQDQAGNFPVGFGVDISKTVGGVNGQKNGRIMINKPSG